ncbi:D-glycero-beta-D-manno-heptose 1,7-bisphosphate 7-phosphatase [soil metagenome]
MKRKAIFLDRDGTLNVEVNYLHRVEDFAWIDGAPEAIKRFNEADWTVIVITNQAGVARGFYTEAAVDALHQHMQTDLAKKGAVIDSFYYSPYHPEGSVPEFSHPSECRKPGAALFERAISDWCIAPAESWAIGDKESDLAPARSLGMRTVLVETGHGLAERARANADYFAADITAAADIILAPSRSAILST